MHNPCFFQRQIKRTHDFLADIFVGELRSVVCLDGLYFERKFRQQHFQKLHGILGRVLFERIYKPISWSCFSLLWGHIILTHTIDGNDDDEKFQLASAMLAYINATSIGMSDGMDFVEECLNATECRNIFEMIFDSMNQKQHYDMMMGNQ